MSDAPQPAEDFWASLNDVGAVADPAQRSEQAWKLLNRATVDPNFLIMLDFAVENNLVTPIERATTWINPVDVSEMVWVPAGPFYVGRDKQPARLPGFSLARHPVTNSQFQCFLDETNYFPSQQPMPETFLQHWTNRQIPKGKEHHPVVWVSYIDAMHYCRWAGLTLPTEWQWEKAARGPDGRKYPWGDELVTSDRLRRMPVANVRSNDTCPVGKFPRTRTAYGCEDMIGNISEWCQMTEGDEVSFFPWPAADVTPKNLHAAVRGSAFLRTTTRRMVSWHRRKLMVARRNRWVGFRPACLLPCRPNQSYGDVWIELQQGAGDPNK